MMQNPLMGGTQSNLSQKQLDETKERYMNFYMIDFLEFNMRKVVFDNSQFCLEKCAIFSNLNNEAYPLPKAEERAQFSCLEKCLGKFSDGYEQALDVFTKQLHTLNSKKVFTHQGVKDERPFLLGEGQMDPVYDKPSFRGK